VVADQLHNGSRHLTLRSGDGLSFLVPAWMVDPVAASVKIVDVPRLSVARLLDLRAFLDSGVASRLGGEIPEGALMKQWTSAQQDLFEERPESRKLGALERAKALEQLQVLLSRQSRNQTGG
jgi:hypothetical protein